MKTMLGFIMLALAMVAAPVHADEYQDAVAKFRQSPATKPYFNSAYGYAIFPTIGKGGIGIGGAYGKGRVYKGSSYVGDASLTQVSIGFQLGGQAFSELIFFKNKAAFDNFTTGNFSFDAEASAVAITLGAGAQAGTSGASANADKYQSDAAYVKGVTVFSMQTGGLMYEAALGGQKFSYEARKK